jgi:PrtD family type I secretion system ABC transporter
LDFPRIKSGFLSVLKYVVAFSFGINLLMLTIPIYMLQLYDRVLTSQSYDSLWFLFAIAALAMIVMSVLDGARSLIMSRLGAWIDNNLSATILSRDLFQAAPGICTPEAQNYRDFQVVRRFIGGSNVYPLLDAPWAPVFLLVLFVLHPLIGFLALGAILILCGTAVVNDLVVRNVSEPASEASHKTNQQAVEAISNAEAIKGMRLSGVFFDQWIEQKTGSNAVNSLLNERGLIVAAFSRGFRLFMQIAVLTLGAYLVLKGEMTAGGIIAASILLSRALSPFDQAISTWRGFSSACQAYKRLINFADDKDKKSEFQAKQNHIYGISAQRLYFGYQKGADPVLRNINFELQPGESLGVLGPTGAGKSTLLRILVGNLKATSGNYRIWEDGDPSFPARQTDCSIGYVPQDIRLLSSTVLENIRFYRPFDEKRFNLVSQVTGVTEFVHRMPNGYETRIGDGGFYLSAGQRQQIAIARAIYGNSGLIIFDEPNSNLDQNGENALIRTLAHLSKTGVTFVIVSHKGSFFQHVTKLMALKDGESMLFGPRDDVMSKLIQFQREQRGIPEKEIQNYAQD